MFVILGKSILFLFQEISTEHGFIPGDIYNPDTKTWDPNGNHIIRQQDFWFSFGMTVFILIPWFTVREVKVDVEIVSIFS